MTLKHELSLYVLELENMLHMTNHRVRSPLCSCLGLIQLLHNTINEQLSDDDRDTILTHLKSNILLLDNFTKDLTSFLEQAHDKRRTSLTLQSATLSN